MIVLAKCIDCDRGFDYDRVRADVYVSDDLGLLRLVCPRCAKLHRDRAKRQAKKPNAIDQVFLHG